MISVYAFVAAPVTFEGLHGVDGAELEVVACGQMHAVISHHETPVGLDRTQVWEHGRVVEALTRQVATLPVRFGSTHTDVAALQTTVADQQTDLAARLAAVAGHVEFVVRAPVSAPGAAPRGADGSETGRAYLEGRLDEERAQRAAWQAARARLEDIGGPLTRLAGRTVEADGRRGPEISYLVATERAERFQAAATAACEDTDFVVGGPWAPYTFASEWPHAG